MQALGIHRPTLWDWLGYAQGGHNLTLIYWEGLEQLLHPGLFELGNWWCTWSKQKRKWARLQASYQSRELHQLYRLKLTQYLVGIIIYQYIIVYAPRDPFPYLVQQQHQLQLGNFPWILVLLISILQCIQWHIIIYKYGHCWVYPELIIRDTNLSNIIKMNTICLKKKAVHRYYSSFVMIIAKTRCVTGR